MPPICNRMNQSFGVVFYCTKTYGHHGEHRGEATSLNGITASRLVMTWSKKTCPAEIIYNGRTYACDLPLNSHSNFHHTLINKHGLYWNGPDHE